MAAVGGPLALDARGGAWSRRDRWPCRWRTADPSHPTTVRLVQAAGRASVARHPGLLAAGFVLPRQPGPPAYGHPR